MLILNVSSVFMPSSELAMIQSTSVFATTSDEEEESEAEQETEGEDQQQPEELSDGPPPEPQQQPLTQSQQQTTQPSIGQQQQPPLEDFILGGKIVSLLPIGADTWIADGNWNLVAENGGPKSFLTQMKWTSADGTTSHTHELQNFELTGNSTDIVMTPNDTVILEGEIDVGTNGAISWENVPASIYLGNGQTIAVSLDDQATNSHFGGQTVFGLVTAATPCGSAPGPNMQILPPCE
jgi:hypothetical protein